MAIEPLAGEGDVSRDGCMEVDGASDQQIVDLDLAIPSQEGSGTCAPIEDLDEVLADFLPELPGPFGSLLYSEDPLGWLAGLIERHHLKPEAKDAAEGL